MPPISCVRRSPVSSWDSRRLENKPRRTPDSTCDLRCRKAGDRAEELHRTIDDLLQVARLPSDQWAAAEPIPLDDVLAEAERRWHGPLAKQGRRLAMRRRQGMATAEVPGRVVGQILDILLDNALGTESAL